MHELVPNHNARFAGTLGVVAQAPHWMGHDGMPWAYEPYVREMRIWADLFERVCVCAPTGNSTWRGNLAPYERQNIGVVPVDYSSAPGWRGIRQRVRQLPTLAWRVRRLIRASNFVLVRSPNHMATLAMLWLRLTRQRSITKWAGENGPYCGEKVSLRVNRWLESIVSQRHPVLVYGPPKRPHQIEFMPALMSDQELQQATAVAQSRRWSPPWQILSVGRLEPVKGFHLALCGLGELVAMAPWVRWQYTVVGDGSARRDLEHLADECGIRDRVTFTGALPFDAVQQHYVRAHVVIMPGTMEGWPKVIAEAWAHGAVPVAAAAGLVPWILRDADTGLTFEPTPESLAEGLSKLLASTNRMQAISARGREWAAGLSLQQFRSRLEEVLVTRCGLQPRARADEAELRIAS